MTLEEFKTIRDSYMVETTRSDGRKSTRGEYMRLCLDGGVDLVTSKDLVVFDDDNETVHAVCINEDMKSQCMFPVKIISSEYSIIQQVETIMSQKDFEAFLNEGFMSNIISAEKKEAMIRWTRSITNQAQQPLEAEPYFNTNPKIISMPNSSIERDDNSIIDTASAVSNVDELLACLNNNDNIIVITKDIDMGKEPVVISSDSDIVIDLDGNTITSSGETLFKLTNGKLIITNGNINTLGEAFRLDATGGTAPELVLEDDVNVVSDNDCCIFVKGPAKITSLANLTSNGEYCPIQGNGNADSAGSEINIIGGTIIAKDIAIYHPQDGILNLRNCNITGTTAIYAKAGTINIYSGTYTGVGAAADYKFNNNGCNSTGDAIVADLCGYPGGLPTINIKGGSFYSDNNDAIEAYDKDGNSNPEIAKSYINITGGSFTPGLNANYIEENYNIIHDENTGMDNVVAK